MEPIDLDSSSEEVIDLSEESNDDVIEVCEIHDHNDEIYGYRDGQYDDIMKENKFLGELIEKCLDLESTHGMIRVIDRSLIKAYYSTSATFRKSQVCNYVICKAIRKLDSDPDHKFSHVKELCNSMKQKSKMMDQAMANKAKYPSYNKRKKKRKWSRRKKLKTNEIENIVLSDESSGFEVPIISIDEYYNRGCNNINCSTHKARSTHEIDGPIRAGNSIDKENELKELRGTKNIETEDVEIVHSCNNVQASFETNISHNSLLQDKHYQKPSRDQSNIGAMESDTLVSSSEITSTVYADDKYDKTVEHSLYNDALCDDDGNALVSTTKELDEEKIYLTPDNITDSGKTLSVVSENMFKESMSYENKKLPVLDKENTHKAIPAPKDKENGNCSIEKGFEVASVVTNEKQDITGFDNDLIILDEDEENKTNRERQGQTIEKLHSAVLNKDNNGRKTEVNENEDLIVLDDDEDTEKVACSNNIIVNNSLSIVEDMLLVPHKAEVFSGPTEDSLMTNIIKIENEIAECKTKIAQLEEEEVNHDSVWSPYIQCEKYKSKIVKLYKDLCKLTGERAVKRREVRLKATKTRSQLCVNKLEDFINSNIGHDGLPHFPDFQDVLQCVRDANKEAELGWNRNEVMREANALFTYCGRALQESRKRREWRDMLSLVKSELIEDPADYDPELMARLQANRQAAVKSEKELLDRYCEMSYQLPSAECSKENDINGSDSENETDYEEIDESTRKPSQLSNNNELPYQNSTDSSKVKATPIFSENLVNANINKSTENVNSVIGDIEKDVPIITTFGSHIRKRLTPIKLEDTSRNVTSETREVLSQNDPYNILNHNFNMVTKVVLDKIDVSDLAPTVVKKENTMDESGTGLVNKMKEEPSIDIQEELDKLGSNFTTTIIDIEDPCLIVEISSDSEYDVED